MIRTILVACVLMFTLMTNARQDRIALCPAQSSPSLVQENGSNSKNDIVAYNITDPEARHFHDNNRQLVPGLEISLSGRSEYSRNRTDGGNNPISVTPTFKYLYNPAISNLGILPDTSVFAHGSRFYINKFGALLI